MKRGIWARIRARVPFAWENWPVTNGQIRAALRRWLRREIAEEID